MTSASGVSFLLVASAVLIAGLQEPVHITEPYKITPNYRRSLFDEAGIVTGARQCLGGSGRMLKARYERCTTGLPSPCVLTTNGSGRSEVVFVPSENTKDVEIRTSIISNGEIKQWQNSLPNVNLEAGKEYVFTTAGGSTAELQGRFFTGQMEILRSTDKQVELCAQADFYVI